MLSLERLLDGLDVVVETFNLCSLGPGERLALPARDEALLHYGLAGHGRLGVAEGAPIAVAANTVVILPPRRPHWLEGPLEMAGAGGAGEPVLLACSRLSATYRQTHGLFDYLDRPLVQRVEDEDLLARALVALIAEQRAPSAGAAALSRALMQQVLVLILRRYCASGECRLPWLSALEDPRLGRALAAIFERPAAPHSLERLAEIAGMSRSAFAGHFQAAFERSPMDLLREVRLREAARLLLASDLPVKALAARVGYDSRSYFSRAFKDFFGCTPAAYRARRPAAPAAASATVDGSPAQPARRGISTV